MKYFVKLAGKAFGPLDEDKIVEMYQAGRLKDPAEISRDKKIWDPIDQILPKTEPEPPALPPFEPLIPSTPAVSSPSQTVPVVPAPSSIEDVTQKFVDPSAPVWYYSSDGSKGYGPVTKSDLSTMLQCGMLKSSSLVWRQGENSRPISIVPELTDILVFSSSSASSDGLSSEANSLPPIPPIPDNAMYSALPSNNPGLGAFRSDAASGGFNSSANMFDLLDDPNFGNDGLGQNAPNHLQVGQTSRMSYALMALFFGQLGIHNFYASRMDIAVVQLFIGLSNLVGLVVISIVSLATEGQGKFLFYIPAIIGFALELWSIIEMCVVTVDGTGKRMY